MRLTIDASVYVSFLSKDEIHHEVSTKFFSAILAHKTQIFNPEIVILEVISALSRKKTPGATLEATRTLLLNQKNVRFQPLTREMTLKSLEIIHTYRLRSADAFYCATASANDSDFLITWDQEILKSIPQAKSPEQFLKLANSRTKN